MKQSIIGYQIIKTNSKFAEIPDQFFSFEIFSKKDADKWVKDNSTNNQWQVVPIHEGDIEEPVKSSI